MELLVIVVMMTLKISFIPFFYPFLFSFSFFFFFTSFFFCRWWRMKLCASEAFVSLPSVIKSSVDRPPYSEIGLESERLL